MLKDAIYDEKGNNCLKQFKQTGFNIEKWDILVYEDPWYTKFLKYFTQ